MVLEQVGMASSALESNFMRCLVDFIDKYPVVPTLLALNMTFKRIFPLAVKRVVFALRRQRLFVDDHVHYFNKFSYILMTFFGFGKFLFELRGTERFKHKSASQFLKQFLKRIAPFDGNLPPHHGPAFLNSGDGFGVGHIVFSRADGAFARMCRLLVYSRNKNKHNRTRRHFGGNVDGQSVVGRYFYGFRNIHEVSIA